MTVKPVAVYRLFDADGRLLYVGHSGDPFIGRWKDHAQNPWAYRVTRITAEWFPDREAARLAEGRAIMTEDPWFNLLGQYHPMAI